MMNRGPAITEVLNYKESLIKFIDHSSKYVANLSDFDKYCLWRYTIGSASVNSQLIFGRASDNSPYWTYLFFLYYNNTFKGTHALIPGTFNPWKKYFDKPGLFNKLGAESQLNIAGRVIEEYIRRLQKIILEGPKTPGVFHVTKVASKYPALPDSINELPSSVLQLPFNSTTVNPYFNYAPFISPSATCCLFDIEVPAGSSCLYIPTDLHAYNFEHEIILPHSCFFDISDIRNESINYIDPASVNITQVQDKSKIIMGNVYTINEYYPCKVGRCFSQVKTFTTYYAKYRNP